MKKKFIIIVVIIVILLGIALTAWKFNNKEEIVDEQIVSEIIEENQKDIIVEYNIEQTWKEGENTASKYNVKIINESKEDVENWSILFDVNETTQISQFWNGKLEINESKLTVNSESYNNIIQKENEIELGFILLDKEDEVIKGYKLYINGKEYMESIEEKEDNEEVMTVEENNLEGTPVDIHGNISVNGTKIVDKNGENFTIQGVSTHGIAWFPEYVNYDTFKTLRDDFNVNTIRLAMYSDKNAGYTESLHQKVSEGVDYATNLGMYVIIDWHILNDNNPNKNKESAIKFLTEMANKYKDYDNVLYEICNEPNGNVTWEKDIKPYAKELIGVIRNIDKDNIIIVGTPTWSQDVDIVSQNPISDYDNIVYALHFYAATHKEDLRGKLKIALNNNLPVLVSEFGICDASGNGTIDINEANKWIDTLKENDVGYVCWNLSNKNESSSILKSTTTTKANWTEDELSEEGKWLKRAFAQ